MPRHDYRCPVCQRVQEVYDPMGLPDYLIDLRCGTCPGSPSLEKLPSAPNFTIKGYSAKNGYSK